MVSLCDTLSTAFPLLPSKIVVSLSFETIRPKLFKAVCVRTVPPAPTVPPRSEHPSASATSFAAFLPRLFLGASLFWKLLLSYVYVSVVIYITPFLKYFSIFFVCFVI